jgi:hypothetical protein
MLRRRCSGVFVSWWRAGRLGLELNCDCDCDCGFWFALRMGMGRGKEKEMVRGGERVLAI